MKPEVAIVGAGYVGLPLGRCFAEAGIPSFSSTSTPSASRRINRGESYVEDVPSRSARAARRGRARSRRPRTTTPSATPTRSSIALPTPLSANREPDLSIVLAPRASSAERLRPGHLVVARVHDVPGDDPRGGAADPRRRAASRSGKDFFLAFSPERIDPGRDRLDDEDDAEGRRRRHAGVHRAGGRASTSARSTRSSPSPRRRRRS